MKKKKRYQKGAEVNMEPKTAEKKVDAPATIDKDKLRELEALNHLAERTKVLKPDGPIRDSLFVDSRYITTDPITGLISEGPDPLSPRQRIEEMAIRNKRIDRNWEDRNTVQEELNEEYIDRDKTPSTGVKEDLYFPGMIHRKGGQIRKKGGAVKGTGKWSGKNVPGMRYD